MPKRPPIRPIFSKMPSKNVYEWWDPKAQRYVKCAAFEIDLWDNETGTRVRRRVRADYQTAKEHYKELARLVRDGNESLPTLIKRHKIRTIGDLLNRYEKAKSEPSLKNRQVRSPLTIKRIQVAVRGFQRALSGDPPLKLITTEVVERYIKVRLDTDHTRGGINTSLRMLRALFNWGVMRNYVIGNPFSAVELFPVERPEPRPLSPIELEHLFVVSPPGSRWHPLIMVYLLTGARLSEVLKPKLTWDHIDFENEILFLEVRKGHKSTEFPLDPVLVEIFRQLRARPYIKTRGAMPDDSNYPFPFHPGYVSHKVKSILNSAGVDATVHDLRDSFVSHLIYLGYPLEDVSKMAGHASTLVTERHYYKQFEERRRQMLTELGQHIIGQSKTPTKNVDKTRSIVPNPDQIEELLKEANSKTSPSEIGDFESVPRTRFERVTYGLEGRCVTRGPSSQLLFSNCGLAGHRPIYHLIC